MTTDPYDILGVPREATVAEIEARYRLLLRTFHPDLHHGEGDDAVAEAQDRTQQLTWAMGVIRGKVPPGSGPPGGRRGPGPSPGSGSAGPRSGQWVGDNPFWRPGADDAGAGTRDAGGPAGDGAAGHGPAGDGPAGDDPPWAEYDWFGNRMDRGPEGPVPCPFCGRPFEDLGAYEVHLERAHHYRQVTVKRRRQRDSRFWRYVGNLRYLPPWLVLLLSFVLWFMFGFYAFVAASLFLALVLWTQTTPRFRNRRP